MSADFTLIINPVPVALSVPAALKVQAAIFTLHALTPLRKIIFSQNANDPPNTDTHQFQVYTQDARAWLDTVNGWVGGQGESPTPSMSRGAASVGEWAYAEWVAIQNLRLAIYQMHNGLDEPSLIKFIFVASEIVLNASPSSATAGVGNITATWDSPAVGHIDWIALYLVGDPNTSPQPGWYILPDGATTGTHAFATPATPGTYELRYLVANSFTSVQTSNPITVT